jgi:gamma-glutamyl phosphate reductase
MTDRRPTLTVKGPAFTKEFRAKLNKAAKKQGKTQAAFVAEVLEREATRVLQGTPLDNPSDTPPPPAIVARLEDTDHRISELAEQVRKLTEMQKRSFWHKLKGAFMD